MQRRASRWLLPGGVWVAASALFVLAILWVQWAHPDAMIEGFKLRAESSDSAWQTIRLSEMFTYGPSTLWWMHIYPPLYDGIRYLLMQPEVLAGKGPDPASVDFRLYGISAVLFGFVSMVVFIWVRDLTKSRAWGIIGAALWVIAPASLSFMILLNQTGLALATMAVAFYLLYRFCRTRRNVYAYWFFIAIFIASLTRNVVQIHVYVVIVISAIAFWRMGRPRLWRALAVNLFLIALIGFWPARAYVLYDTFDVSTHTGYNRAGALWINPFDVPTPTTYPANIVENATKLSSAFNTQETMKDNYRLGNAANDLVIHHPVQAINNAVKSLSFTVPTMFRSVYIQWYNSFDFAFPLTRSLDWIFSGWRFATLILGSWVIIIRHFGLRGTLNRFRRYGWFAAFWILTAIPVFLSNRYWPPEVPEPVHSEADRLRGLIDVPVYVLMTFAAWIVFTWIRRRFFRGRIPTSPVPIESSPLP